MRLLKVSLAAYGRCSELDINLGKGVTVVFGSNEAGKSTALDALNDLLWGIPTSTPHISVYTRPNLRIDAELELGGTHQSVVRISRGLFSSDDLLTSISAPWDSDNRLTSQWWRTRMGISHSALQDGGEDVFKGSGDIAEAIFAARQGRSARELLDEITEEINLLFKPHGGAKKVYLRVAAKEYRDALADRDSRLIRAGDVVAQRRVVNELDRKLQNAKTTKATTARALKQAEDDRRCIEWVLELRQARFELAVIDAEGDRLSPAELDGYIEAKHDHADAETGIAKLDSLIASRTRDIECLSVEDRLLDDKVTIDRLHPTVTARIDDLYRADNEFGPAAATATADLKILLESIGITEGASVDDMIRAARVRGDHAADLDSLADQIEELETRLASAKEELDRSRRELSALGITLDISSSRPPSPELIDKIRDALTTARNKETTASELFSDAQELVEKIKGQAPTSPITADLTRTDVDESREGRDTQWRLIRGLWIVGDLPAQTERIDLAAEFDNRLNRADQISDGEAHQRALVAAQDARIGAHVEGLEAALDKEKSTKTAFETAAEKRRQVEAEWANTWSGLGVSPCPSIDNGPIVTGLLRAAHTAHESEISVAEELATKNVAWAAVAASVGLAASSTTIAWRKQAQILALIESTQSVRATNQDKDTQARLRWQQFTDEAVELLRRHDALDASQPITPAHIEQSFAKVAQRLDNALESAAKRTTYQEQVEEKRKERDSAVADLKGALERLHQLAAAHAIDLGPELEILAERAERASEPTERESNALKQIKTALGRGVAFQDVIDRLAESDEISVDAAGNEASEADEAARQTYDEILELRRSEKDHLDELESAAGAADAEEEVASKEAELANLTERWALLTLQKRLLLNVLENLADGEARPLLDHAGEILDQLTGGRWVALRAEEETNSRRLVAVRSDAEFFDSEPLSEGTADQAFLALRLAAVAELHNDRVSAGEEPLPLVLDDALIAFDDDRTKRALEVLQSLAPGLQVIVFTHHRSVAEAAADLEGITVSHLPPPAPIENAIAGETLRARA